MKAEVIVRKKKIKKIVETISEETILREEFKESYEINDALYKLGYSRTLEVLIQTYIEGHRKDKGTSPLCLTTVQGYLEGDKWVVLKRLEIEELEICGEEEKKVIAHIYYEFEENQ